MAAQLLGSGGIATLLLLAAASGMPAAVDVALTAGAARGLRLGRLRAHGHGSADRRLALDVFSVLAIVAGCFFFLAGTVGLLRFPDPLTRLHALTKADNLGLGLVVVGLLPHADWPLGALKLVAVWLLVLLAGGTVSQLIARVAQRSSP